MMDELEKSKKFRSSWDLRNAKLIPSFLCGLKLEYNMKLVIQVIIERMARFFSPACGEIEYGYNVKRKI